MSSKCCCCSCCGANRLPSDDSARQQSPLAASFDFFAGSTLAGLRSINVKRREFVENNPDLQDDVNLLLDAFEDTFNKAAGCLPKKEAELAKTLFDMSGLSWRASK